MTIIDIIFMMVITIIVSLWIGSIGVKNDLQSGKLKIIKTNQGLYVEDTKGDK